MEFMSVLMRNKFNEEVNIPDKDIQMALNSGYTYVSSLSSQPISIQSTQQTTQPVQTTTVLNQQTGLLEKVPAQPTSQIQLPPSVDKILDLLQDDLTKRPVNPDVEISPALMQQYLQQAKTELQPYYSQLFQQAQQDVTGGMKQIGEDVLSKERQLESQYGQSLENIQEQAAQRGLTFSTKRAGAERTLAESTQAAIDAGRREAERRALTLGTQGERALGTQNIPQIPGVEEAPTPILNMPGQYTFARPTTTRSLFSPAGSTSGTLEQSQLEAERKRQAELAGAERQLRGAYTI